MKKIFFISIVLSVIFLECLQTEQSTEQYETQLNSRLPKVLFITNGINFNTEDPDLPQGINTAIQIFNKRGIPVRLEPRDVLFDFDFLCRYNIIILSSAAGYHDADRKYSLTYMNEAELKNLNKYVKLGGVIIAGDNIGRNRFDGTDRISLSQQLDTENYPLAEVFGVVLKERNMRGYEIYGNITETLKGEFLPADNEDLWTLVPKVIISENINILANRQNDTDTIPAIIQNKFGKGTAYLLSSSDFLNPANTGGYWSVKQIEDFYNYVADEYYKENNIEISLNAWGNTYNCAFCVTFNTQGDVGSYKYLLKKLNKLDVKPVFFVNSLVNDTVKKFLLSDNIELASTGANYLNYQNLSYNVILNDILLNEHNWKRKFKGFRFPFTSPNFTGLTAVDLQSYTYTSSISVNNSEFLHGSVFPYNIVISQDKFYKSTDILEIAPSYRDDYFFLHDLIENTDKNTEQQKEVVLYEEYLRNFWTHTVKPYNGLMVYIGHPNIVGFNDTTFSALENLILQAKNDNAWITTINEIADYRAKLEKFDFYVENNKSTYKIYVKATEGIEIKDITININREPQNVTALKGKAVIKKNKQFYSIVFDAFNGQIVTVEK